MADFVISKDMTPTKVKTEVKKNISEVIFNALVAAYGEDCVAWVRTGNGTSKTNEIGVMVSEVENGNETVWACATVNASAKDFISRSTQKKGTIPAFDFYEAKAEYESYLAEKATKEADKAAAKAKKIEKDAKNRAAAQSKQELTDF